MSELVNGLQGLLLADKGDSCEVWGEDLAQQGLTLLTLLRRNMKQYHPQWHRTVSRHRQLVETVIDHWCHWFGIEHFEPESAGI